MRSKMRTETTPVIIASTENNALGVSNFSNAFKKGKVIAAEIAIMASIVMIQNDLCPVLKKCEIVLL